MKIRILWTLDDEGFDMSVSAKVQDKLNPIVAIQFIEIIIGQR